MAPPAAIAFGDDCRLIREISIRIWFFIQSAVLRGLPAPFYSWTDRWSLSAAMLGDTGQMKSDWSPWKRNWRSYFFHGRVVSRAC